jgi:uncharacterized membrane protein
MDAPRQPADLPVSGEHRRFFLLRATLFPQHYVWFVFVSSLDIMFTWLILHYGEERAQEVNPVADAVIAVRGLPGLVVFKFLCVVVVVLVCEIVGRIRHKTGLWLAWLAVILAMVPVLVGAAHMGSILREVRVESATPVP